MGTGESFLKGQFEVTLENLAAHHGPNLPDNLIHNCGFCQIAAILRLASSQHFPHLLKKVFYRIHFTRFFFFTLSQS